jgi:phosphoglycerate dehydrogenase-like enzyme
VNILVTNQIPESVLDQIKRIVPGANVTVTESKEEIVRQLPEAEIVWGHQAAAHIDLARKLRWMQVSSAGVNHILTPELVGHPSVLTNARGIHAETIAEHVFMYVLAFARGLVGYQKHQRAGTWEPRNPMVLAGMTMGVVGMGSIGQEVGRKAKAFDMKVIGMRKSRAPSEYADEMVDESELPYLLAQSDFIILAVPLTSETRHLIGEVAFGCLKPSAYLINIARGDVVDEKALTDALAQKKLAGAGLDVFETEPLPADSPLWQMENVIITPHMAGYLPDYLGAAAEVFLENLRRYVRGERLKNIVDKRRGY